jgi:DNA gyrase subunit B
VVNALSGWLRARVQRDGFVWTMAFQRGRTTEAIVKGEATDQTGTRIQFLPDSEIFQSVDFHYDILSKRLRELAYLNSGVTITLRDEREDKEDVYFFEHGIRQFVEHLNDGKNALHDPLYISKEDPESRLIAEVALQYTDGYNRDRALLCQQHQHRRRRHAPIGLPCALITRALNNYARKNNLYKSNDPVPSGDDIREGLTTVISVKVPEPQFEGQTKTKLGNSDVGTFVETTVGEATHLIPGRTPLRRQAHHRESGPSRPGPRGRPKARETARKSAMAGGALSRKLVDCSSRDVADRDLHR